MIPSYDDLTPGIPDDLKTGVGAVREPPTVHEDRDAGQTAALYACLRRSPDHQIAKSPDLLLAIARDFSPRVMRASDREILFDVSGLGRLIGEPPAIAAALARAIAEAGEPASVA